MLSSSKNLLKRVSPKASAARKAKASASPTPSRATIASEASAALAAAPALSRATNTSGVSTVRFDPSVSPAQVRSSSSSTTTSYSTRPSTATTSSCASTMYSSRPSAGIDSTAFLLSFMRCLSAVSVIAAVLLAVIAITPTILIVLHGYASYLAGTCAVVGRDHDCGMLAQSFIDHGTISSVAADFATPAGRVFFGAMLLSSIIMFTSQWPFWLLRRTERKTSWVFVGDVKIKFVTLFAGSLGMGLVSLIACPDRADSLVDIAPMMCHILGFFACLLTLMAGAWRQLHVTERAFYRWPRSRPLLREAPEWRKTQWKMEGRAPLEELKLQRLDWDQEWRCFLLVSAIVWFVLLLALQTPITFGILDFNLAVGSVVAEAMCGACCHAGLLCSAFFRLNREDVGMLRLLSVISDSTEDEDEWEGGEGEEEGNEGEGGGEESEVGHSHID